MALNTRNLTAPGDVQSVDGAKIAGSLGGGGSMPTWGVGDPVATAVAGFQQGMVKFKEHYDRAKADEFLINKKMELDKMYFDKDTGLFNTRKGEAAQGLYQEGAEYMRQMWDKDAMDNLSEEQRALASKGMGQLFTDYSHKIAKFETDEMINGTKNRINNTLYNVQNMMSADGGITEEDLAMGMYAIRSGVESLGKLQGLDDETIRINQEQQLGEMFKRGSAAMAAKDPHAALGMVKTYLQYIPEAQREAILDSLDSKCQKARIEKANNLAAQKDFPGAYEALGIGRGFKNGGTIQEDYNNLLNEKWSPKTHKWQGNNRADTKQYENMGEGVRGNADLIKTYVNRDGKKSVKDIVYKWAPPSENRSASYVANVSKALGVSPDADISDKILNDNDFLSKMMLAMAKEEGPMGNKLKASDIKEMLEGGNGPEWASKKLLKNGDNLAEYQKHTGMLEPSVARSAADKIEAYEKKVFIDDFVSGTLERVKDDPALKTRKEREARAVELTQEIKDPADQKRAYNQILTELERTARIEDAANTRLYSQFYKDLQKNYPSGLSIAETREIVTQSQLPQEVKDMINLDLNKRVEGVDNSVDSEKGLVEIRKLKDAGVIQDENHLLQLCKQYELNAKDIERARQYDGRANSFSQSKIFELIRKATGIADEGTMAKLYSAFMLDVDPGEASKESGGKWDNNRIMNRLKFLYNEVVERESGYAIIPNTRTPLYEAVNEGKMDDVLPKDKVELDAVTRQAEDMFPWLKEAGLVPPKDRRLIISQVYQRNNGRNFRLSKVTEDRLRSYQQKWLLQHDRKRMVAGM